MKKRTVFGLPLNPQHLLAQLVGHSFCVSYWHRNKLGRQLESAIKLVGEDQMLMLDNGAYSAWQSGATMDADYWDGFARWAIDIMDRCPQAVMVVPDVIDGDVQANHELACEFMSSLALDHGRVLDRDRCMVVWHLHEPIEYLTHMVEGGWQYIAFGSSGQYARVGTPEWHGRIKEAFAALDELCQPGSGYRRPWIHMMRAQAEFHRYPFDSCDSCNVAVNHNVWRKRNPGDFHVSRFARVIKTRVDASVSGEERESIESPSSLARFLRESARARKVRVRQTELSFMGA
jgi:hypothetical protein